MPRYDYACHECGHRFEAVHSITDDPLSVCPECGGALRRVIGPVGVAFKGSGFYRTDSRQASKKSGSSAATAATGDRSTAPATSPAPATPSSPSASSPPASSPTPPKAAPSATSDS